MCKGKHSAPYVISLIRKSIAEVRMQEDTGSGSARSEAVPVLLLATKLVVLNQHAFGNGIVLPGKFGLCCCGRRVSF